MGDTVCVNELRILNISNELWCQKEEQAKREMDQLEVLGKVTVCETHPAPLGLTCHNPQKLGAMTRRG